MNKKPLFYWIAEFEDDYGKWAEVHTSRNRARDSVREQRSFLNNELRRASVSKFTRTKDKA